MTLQSREPTRTSCRTLALQTRSVGAGDVQRLTENVFLPLSGPDSLPGLWLLLSFCK